MVVLEGLGIALALLVLGALACGPALLDLTAPAKEKKPVARSISEAR